MSFVPTDSTRSSGLEGESATRKSSLFVFSAILLTIVVLYYKEKLGGTDVARRRVIH